MKPNPYLRASLAIVAALVLGSAVTAGAQSLSGTESISEVRPVEARADVVRDTTTTASPTPSGAEAGAASRAEVAALQAEADREAEVLAYYKRLEEEAAYFKALEEQAYFAEMERKAAVEAAAAYRPVGVPDDSYWDRMATCETGGNWSMSGSRYSGGVGFANTTWNAWGGREFAPNAGQATREQQIVVANRVATQGYGSVAAVGYSGWGCARHSVGYP